jgi:hypothetical protein
MLGGQAIIDTTADPIAAAARRHRTIRRVGIPIFGVVLMIALILVALGSGLVAGVAIDTLQPNS